MKFFVIVLLALLYCSCSRFDETIKIKGSDSEVNLAVMLAEQFPEVNPEMLVSVSGGGSGLGLASLLNGNADIANSSRSIKPSELDLFRQKGVEIDSFIFAQDAVAFVVSDKLSIDSLHTIDIAKILSGQYANWSSFNQAEQAITVYGRQSNSGTQEYVKDRLGIRFSPHAKQMNGNAQIIEAIKTDPSGFGYVSAGYVLKGSTAGIKVLSVYTDKTKAVSPLDAAAVAKGNYYFQRPLFQYFRKKDYHKVKPFLDFEKSATGAKIIQESGYYPAK